MQSQSCTHKSIRPERCHGLESEDQSQEHEPRANDAEDNKQEETTRVIENLRTVTEICDELVFEILVRLPVKSLGRFKSVSKAWRATISDTFFIRAHLRQSAINHERRLASFLIASNTLYNVAMINGEPCPRPRVFRNELYLWQVGQANMRHLQSPDFNGEHASVYSMVHCDGLVMLPTKATVYVLNPATGDILRLPNIKDVGVCKIFNFGLDSRTNKYKVARFFYRSLDATERTYDARMEVFTIRGGDSVWRSTVDDPPYPIQQQPQTYFKGSFYWVIWKEMLSKPPGGFLRFSLEDETFGFIRQPASLSDGNVVDLAVLGGELCLVENFPAQMVIWMTPSGDGHEWVRLYDISLSTWLFQPLCRTISGGLLIRSSHGIFRYDEANRDMKEVVPFDRLGYRNPRLGSVRIVGKDLFLLNVTPYTESLVPVTMPSVGTA